MCVGLYLDTHFHITFSESPFKKKKTNYKNLQLKSAQRPQKKKKLNTVKQIAHLCLTCFLIQQHPE